MEIMKIFSDLYDEERLYSVLMSEEEISLFSEMYPGLKNRLKMNEIKRHQDLPKKDKSIKKNPPKSFEDFKNENKNPHGLPFGFRDSRGAFMDGRIKAETEEEYNKAARKMMKDHEKSLKSFSETKKKKKKKRLLDRFKEAMHNGTGIHNNSPIPWIPQGNIDSINMHGIPQGHIDSVNMHGIASGIGPMM